MTKRKFPAYTTAQLEEAVALYDAGNHPMQATTDAAHIEALKDEITARNSGTSKAFATPHYNGPLTIRMV